MLRIMALAFEHRSIAFDKKRVVSTSLSISKNISKAVLSAS